MDEHYVMWVKADCPYCIDARDELYNQRVDHTIKIMDAKLDELGNLFEKWDHHTVPLIIHQNNNLEVLVGGYTDLKKWFDIQKE